MDQCLQWRRIRQQEKAGVDEVIRLIDLQVMIPVMVAVLAGIAALALLKVLTI